MLKKIKQNLLVLLFVVVLSFGVFVNPAKSAAVVAWSTSAIGGDSVQLQVMGEADSVVQLFFYPIGAVSSKSVLLGTTDHGGNFVKTISSGAYSIPSGVKSYISVGGKFSTTLAWPSYYSTLLVNPVSARLNVGQTLFITPSHTVSVSFNSNISVVKAVVSEGQIMLAGSNLGTATVSVCGANVGCASIDVSIEAQPSSSFSFSKNSFLMNPNQVTNVNIIYSGLNNGFFISSNSNPKVVEASIGDRSSTIVLSGKTVAGATVITVCSTSASYSCANLYVTNIITGSSGWVNLSQNSVKLVGGQSVYVTASGDSNNSYFVSSNSNSKIVSVYVSGSTIVFTGGSVAGSATVAICSTNTNNVCSSLVVTNDYANTVSDPVSNNSTISFSQNNVVLGISQIMSVTIQGGYGNDYVVSYNTKPSLVIAKINGKNMLTLTAGLNTGSSIINVCVKGSTICGKFYVSIKSVGVSAPSSDISLSNNSVTVAPGQNQSVTINGGNGGNFVILYNTNPKVAIAKIVGNVVTVTSKNNSGNAKIKICSGVTTNSCSILTVTAVSSLVISTSISISQNNLILNQAQTLAVVLAGGSGSYRVYSNSNPSVVTTELKGNTLLLNGGDVFGEATITVCTAANSTDCANIYVTTSSYISPLSFSQKNVVLEHDQSVNLVIYYGTAVGGFTVSFNSNSDIVKASIPGDGHIITLVGGPKNGTAVVSVCSSALSYDCGNIYVTNITSSAAVENILPSTNTENYIFTRDLKYGAIHADVKKMQQYLNNNGFKITSKGGGSPGKETTKFGALTRTALIKFQKAKNILPANGVFGATTRNYINSHL